VGRGACLSGKQATGMEICMYYPAKDLEGMYDHCTFTQLYSTKEHCKINACFNLILVKQEI